MRCLPLLFILLLGSCLPVESTTIPAIRETNMPAYHYLALGDSYTIGESVPVEERWPNQLARLLETEGIQTDLTIIARTGWTVDELWEGIQTNPPDGAYDLVTLLIGVNDQYRGYPMDDYREDFRFVLRKAIDYASGNPDKVIVLSIPDWGFTPFAVDRDTKLVSQQIDAFNAINLEETKLSGAHYLDVTEVSRMAQNDPELIAEDGLHPSGKMYAMWVEKVLPIALEVLR